MIERQVEIKTPSGGMGTFVCHPGRGGPFPVILFFMDAPGIREELRDMARRLAGGGYYVMLPNLYHRAGVEELFTGPNPVSDTRMFELMDETTIDKVMEDADALLSFAAGDEAASPGPAGAIGYCMSGRHAISVAARHPDRIAAAASFYGTRLVTDAPDSPHRTASKARGELYVGYAEHDSYVPLAMVDAFRAASEADGVRAEIELYPGTGHGFAFPSRSHYDEASAERHWARTFALFDRTLRHPVAT